jgi:hypothetical protein
MGWELVGSGEDIHEAADLEDQVDEGQLVKVDCETAIPVGSWHMDALRNSLNAAGVADLQISGGGNHIQVIWRKGFWWMLIIALALVAIIAIVSWQLFKEVPTPIKSIALIGGAVLALAVGYSLFRRQYT